VPGSNILFLLLKGRNGAPRHASVLTFAPVLSVILVALRMKPRRQKLSIRTQATFLLWACLVSSGFANAQRATLLGTITDQAGAVVPGVNVTLLNLDQGLKREASTDGNGYFTVPLLQPGRYLVTAQKHGFAVAEVKDVILHVADVHGLDIKLQVSAIPVEIQVSERSQDVETVSAALGQVVTGDVIRNAPLNGRDVRSLALLQPGVTPVDLDSNEDGNFNVNGNRADSVSYLLDGGLNNDLITNGAVYTPNPDTIAEFRILTSNYPAEYGRNAGGVVSMLTRSGTNAFHGSGFDFLRNDALDANSYFNKNTGLPRDNLKRNQFGGTLGGPITIPGVVRGENRYFFFVGYQGERQNEVLSLHNVPTFTPAELSGDFSHAGLGGVPDPGVAAFLGANPFFQPNNILAKRAIIDPTRINNVARNYIAADLIPTSPTGQLSWQGPLNIGYDELTEKLDFDFSEKNKLAVTLGWSREDDFSPINNSAADVPGFPESSHFNDYFSNFAYTHIFSPNLLNELRVTGDRATNSSLNPAVQLPKPSSLGIGITPDISVGPTSLLFDSGLQIGFSTLGPQRFTDNTFTYADALTWVRGKHNLKFGGGFSAFQNNTFYAFTVDGQFQFLGQGGIFSQNSFADFLLGLPFQYTQSSAAPSDVRTKFTYGFAQDEWRVRRNMVVSLGLRYEYSTPKSDTQGRTFSILPGEQSREFIHAPVGMVFPGDPGAPRGVNFPDENNWAPRIGFAWDPQGNGKTSLRGAFGVFYDILKAEDNLQFNGQPPFYASAGFSFPTFDPSVNVNYMAEPFVAGGATNPFPSRRPPSNLDFAAAGYLPVGASNSVFVVDPHLRTPYTYQYHLSLQREVARGTVFEGSYVGSSSHGLTALTDINPFVLGTYNRVLNLTLGNQTCTVDTFYLCSFASLEEFKNATSANYNGLLLSLQKQLSGDGMFGRTYFTLAYTYAHNIDNASGFLNRNNVVPYYQPNLFRSAADMDIRQRIVFSGGWELPFDKLSNSLPGRLTQGWNLFPIVSWRTGFPLDVLANLPSSVNFASPGPSAAGDGNLVHANLVGPVQIFDPRTVQNIAGSSGHYWFNPTSFSNSGFPTDREAVSNPSLRTYGTLPRNYLRGPGVFNINLALSKTTQITDQVRVETRADFFNLLNRAEFMSPDTNISSPTFGRVLSTYDPRIIQLSLRLSF
jgi:hypothetical protein